MAKTARKRTTKKATASKPAARRAPSRAAKHPQPVRVVRARYDAAQTDAENRKHWSQADSLSPTAANAVGVRRILRNRSRYETANNSYAFGIINTRANHVIGTGPRLQVETGADPKVDEAIEAAFCKWAKRIRLGAKLRTMALAKMRDGESFALMFNNESLETPVKLDLRLIEADHVTSPYGMPETEPGYSDGVKYDAFGNPVSYHVLRQHPGDSTVWLVDEFDVVPATNVLHWFRADRPGMLRGIPETTPALPLHAYLRRWTLAVIAAAETAANFSAVLEAQMLPDDEEDIATPFEEVEVVRNTMTTLPPGYKMNQFKPEQPFSSFADFKKEILNEAARPFEMPFNIAACNSSGYNYSSGRLDHQTYYRSVAIEQRDCEEAILARVFAEWSLELRLAALNIEKEIVEAAMYGEEPPEQSPITSDIPPPSEWKVGWFWDGHESADATKDAQADTSNLANGTTSLAELWAKKGGDWRQGLRQQAIEKKFKQEVEKEFGVKPEPAPSSTNQQPPEDEQDDEEETADEMEDANA